MRPAHQFLRPQSGVKERRPRVVSRSAFFVGVRDKTCAAVPPLHVDTHGLRQTGSPDCSPNHAVLHWMIYKAFPLMQVVVSIKLMPLLLGAANRPRSIHHLLTNIRRSRRTRHWQ